MENGTLFDKHPEWFGQDAQGKRHREQNWVLCTSNPDAVAYLTNNFVEYVKDRPEIQIYDFWPPDGAKWCECDACKQLGTPSDRQAILVNHVKKAIKTVRPDLRLEIIAYHTALLPPEHVKLDPDVLVDFCPISQQFDHQIDDPAAKQNAEYVDALKAWRSSFTGDISIYSYYRKYAWDSLPVIIPHYLQKDLQWYATVPTQGISSYAEPGDWFTYELNHYALAKLAWNPKMDIDAVIDDYCKTRYGAQADLAKKLLMTLEHVVRTYCAVPNSSLKSADDITAALLRLKNASSALGNTLAQETPQINWNAGRLCLMSSYAEQDLEIQIARARNASPDQLQPMINQLHDWLDKNKDVGIILMRDQRLSLSSLQRRYGVGKEK
jgi:hypothetical protein